jgi:hypothetical protein
LTIRFESVPSPTAQQIQVVADVTPQTPFNIPAYAAACAAVGYVPCVIALRDDSGILDGCIGFLKKGRLLRRLEIVSVPSPSASQIFWSGLLRFSRDAGIGEIEVQSYGSCHTDIPPLPGELLRRQRNEYLIDFRSTSFPENISTNHRRNANRARKAGLIVRRTSEPIACGVHLDLLQSSMQRRVDRGEDINGAHSGFFLEALLRFGASELFQAVRDNRILSSILVVRSDKSAYYHSAGTSPDGMNIGASAFLICETALLLRNEGVDLFNLGGASSGENGLQRFKAGFGTKEIKLEAATISLESSIRRHMRISVQATFHAFRSSMRVLKAQAMDSNR